MPSPKIAIIGASGKLGRQLIRVGLERGYEIVGVCREKSVAKLSEYRDRIQILPGFTDDPEVVKRAVANCSGVMVILVPWGMKGYSSGTAQAVLDHAPPGSRLIFSCGWHISKDGKDVYSRKFLWLVKIFSLIAKCLRIVDVDDQVKACNRIFKSDTLWTVVRGSDLEDGESEGLPKWSDQVGDPILAKNRTRRIDYARFMFHAMENSEFIGRAPAISS